MGFLERILKKRGKSAGTPLGTTAFTLPSVKLEGNTLTEAEVVFPDTADLTITINGANIPFTPANYSDFGPISPQEGEEKPPHRILCYGITFVVKEEDCAAFVHQLERMAQEAENHFSSKIGREE